MYFIDHVNRPYIRAPTWLRAPMGDDGEAGLRTFVQRNVEGYLHHVGSCKMGPEPNSGAVVDADGRGLPNLFVADASIHPGDPAGQHQPDLHADRVEGGRRRAQSLTMGPAPL